MLHFLSFFHLSQQLQQAISPWYIPCYFGSIRLFIFFKAINLLCSNALFYDPSLKTSFTISFHHNETAPFFYP